MKIINNSLVFFVMIVFLFTTIGGCYIPYLTGSSSTTDKVPEARSTSDGIDGAPNININVDYIGKKIPSEIGGGFIPKETFEEIRFLKHVMFDLKTDDNVYAMPGGKYLIERNGKVVAFAETTGMERISNLFYGRLNKPPLIIDLDETHNELMVWSANNAIIKVITAASAAAGDHIKYYENDAVFIFYHVE